MISIAVAGGVAGYFAFHYHGEQGPVEVYRGVTYGCVRLATTDEQSGLVHWVAADLAVPGVSLFVTPTDPAAVARGREYRLRYTSTAVADLGLAVAVNATLFDSDSTVVRRPGDYASTVETAVADHAVNHVHRHTYLLWWDDADVAHIETAKPPTPDDLRAARWGVGGQQATLSDGRPNPSCGRDADARTMVGADPGRKRVYLACFDHASARAAALFLAGQGATIGLLVDGGTSTTMALGPDAAGVRPGTVTGNWRPVATVFGVRARPTGS